ncbi:MAG: leucyl aminopeptidase [Proteobacteria bacterium]|nr:leucyl aminopeptidase [Pseudomonadota bacterium]
MNVIDIVVSKKKAEDVRSDLLVVFAVLDKKSKPVNDKIFQGLTLSSEFTAKEEQKLLLYPPFTQKDTIKKSISSKRILVVGLGEFGGGESAGELNDRFRTAGGVIAQICKSSKIKQLAVKLPAFKEIDENSFSEYLVEGLQLGLYQFLKYKKKDDDAYQGVRRVSVVSVSKGQGVRRSIKRGLNSAGAGCVSRDMANEPGNGWTPSDFAKFGKKLSDLDNVETTIFEKDDMKKLGMGGILAVNQGSHEAPKLVVVDYCPEKYQDTIMLVGKGLTFDSGGISIKPSQGMMDMKYDMCGGGAVIAAMEAIALEKPKVRVICLVPSTDNMNGGGAVKPGDIIGHFNGVTSEIENTDAEGRLILADALAYGIATYEPSCVIDLATLTGAVIIALGHHHSGLMCNNDTLAKTLAKAGLRAGEPLWRLPLGPAYAKQIKSKVADIKNTGGRPAGSITAAEYLHKFVGDTPWAHLDIAGTAWDFTEKTYVPKGPSGIGTRTLIEFVRNWRAEGSSMLRSQEKS